MKIELHDINLKFDHLPLLSDLNLTFEPNKINCLLGKSGSGKTSILKIIAGISPQFQGSVYFDSQDVTQLAAKERYVGWVPQTSLLFPGMNVYRNIEYGLIARNASLSKDDRVREVAKLVGVHHLLNRQPERLSGGEKQRVALARALAPQPRILLLDEPFSSLDAPERDRLSLIFREVQLETGITTIHVTHSPREVELIGDYIFILSDGQILQSGPKGHVLSHPSTIKVAKLLNITNAFHADEIPGCDYPVIIPEDAIILNEGEYQAMIISITRDHIHLKLENGTRLRVRNQSNLNSLNTLELRSNQSIPISFIQSQFIRIIPQKAV